MCYFYAKQCMCKCLNPCIEVYITHSFSVYVWMAEYNEAMKEELCMDVYNFGEIILEILTGWRLTNAAASIHRKSQEVLLREIYNDNEVSSTSSLQEIKLVLEVAVLCTRSRSSDRPSMEDALKLLSGLKHLEEGITSK